MSKKKRDRFPKTMPIRALEEKGAPFEVHFHTHDQLTAAGVAEDLGVPVSQVVKAMIMRTSDRRFVLVVVPGDRRLSVKKMAAVLDDKDVALANERDVERVTGFRVGAVSVLGFRRDDIATYVDQEVLNLEQVIISSGRPDAGLTLSSDALLEALEGAEVGDYSEEG